MKRNLLTAIFLATTCLIPSAPLFAQPSPTGQFEPGFWQPEARVSLNRHITFRFLNQTDRVLEYGKAEGYPSTLPPGQTREISISVTRRKGDIATIPINVAEGTYPLQYDYQVNNNVVTVRIRPTSASDPRQDRAVYVDETGLVYSF